MLFMFQNVSFLQTVVCGAGGGFCFIQIWFSLGFFRTVEIWSLKFQKETGGEGRCHVTCLYHLHDWNSGVETASLGRTEREEIKTRVE